MIRINRTGKHLGAEILGVDLSRPLDDGAFAGISDAFWGHQVVVFRDQKLTPSQQIAFTRRFGELEHHVRKEHRLDGHPEILIVSNVVDARGVAIGVQDAGRFWHSDLSYKQVPRLPSALYALEVPVRDVRVLGDTSFASTTAAYEALPGNEKRRLQGLPDDEGAALLARLCAHIVEPEFRYEHEWRAGDLLMWDNVPVQHKANFDYDLPLRRLMHRTTVRGSVPV